MIRKTAGSTIVLLSSILTLAALLGFRYDSRAINDIINAPAFQNILERILVSQRSIFQVVSYVLSILVVMLSLMSLGNKERSYGGMIIAASILNGLCGWPVTTPFMLITMLGAHVALVAEREQKIRLFYRSAGNNAPAAPPPSASPQEKELTPAKESRIKRLWKHFFS